MLSLSWGPGLDLVAPRLLVSSPENKVVNSEPCDLMGGPSPALQIHTPLYNNLLI